MCNQCLIMNLTALLEDLVEGSEPTPCMVKAYIASLADVICTLTSNELNKEREDDCAKQERKRSKNEKETS